MAPVGWIVILFWFMPVVKGDYNCSKSHINLATNEDFMDNLKHAIAELNVNLYTQKDYKLNLTATSDQTNLAVWLWGQCDPSVTSDVCRVS